MQSWARSALSIAGFFCLWEIVARSGLVSAEYFPSPGVILTTIVSETRRGELPHALAATFARALAGASVGSALALIVALFTARYRIAQRAFEPIAEFLRPLPPAAITPLAIFFLGLGWKLYAFILVFACFWPVYLNAAQALGATSNVQIETARTFGYGRWETLLRVRLPAAMPIIFTGLRQAASIALIATIAAEMIAGRDGLGFYLMDAGMTLRVPETFAGLVAAMLAGLVMSGLVMALRNGALRWHDQMIEQAEAA